jgi:hypothetical protein
MDKYDDIIHAAMDDSMDVDQDPLTLQEDGPWKTSSSEITLSQMAMAVILILLRSL